MSEQGALSHPEGADTVDAARLLDHSGRLVVGVDGSEGSMAALRWAVSEAQLRGAAVHIVMAWRHPKSYWPATVWTMMMDSSGDTRQTMATAAETEVERLGTEARQGQNADITWEAAEGPPAEVLVRVAEGAGALVVGSRGNGGFVGVPLGSVSQHVRAHARCPVILIPGPRRGNRADWYHPGSPGPRSVRTDCGRSGLRVRVLRMDGRSERAARRVIPTQSWPRRPPKSPVSRRNR